MHLNRTSRSGARGRSLSAWLGFGAATILVGCSGEARSRVMHFFFEYPEPAAAAVHKTAPSSRPTDAAAVALGPAVRFASRHEPFVKRECHDCHIRATGQEPRADFMAACEECHETLFAYHRFGHAPVVARECRLCHFMHVSRYRGLLKKPQAVLCTDCHPAQQSDSALDSYHKGIEAVRCVACHDPHFADNQLLLKPEEVRRRALDAPAQARAEGSGLQQ